MFIVFWIWISINIFNNHYVKMKNLSLTMKSFPEHLSQQSSASTIDPGNLWPTFCHSSFAISRTSYSSTLAWKILWTEEPGGLQSMGSLGVRHDWATSLWLVTFMHWRRKWQPTPVFLPGESQGRGSLVGCHLWGCTESETTEAT